jgi:hypothetical protein
MNDASFRRAQALVLTALRHNGPTKSHVLVEICISAGLIDKRQIGAVFSGLRNVRLIEPYRKYKKKRGYGIVWASSCYPTLTESIDLHINTGVCHEWRNKGKEL